MGTQMAFLSPNQYGMRKRNFWSEDISLGIVHGTTAHWDLANLAAVQLLSSCAGTSFEKTGDLFNKLAPVWDAASVPRISRPRCARLLNLRRGRVSRSTPGDWIGCEYPFSRLGYDGPLSTCSEESTTVEYNQRRKQSSVKRKPFNAEIINRSKRMIQRRWRRKALEPDADASGTQKPLKPRAEEVENAEAMVTDRRQGSKVNDTKQSLDMVSCPELGRSGQENLFLGESKGLLTLQDSNLSKLEAPTSKFRPLSRHLLRSKSMSAATMASESHRLEARERRRKNRVSCEIFSDSPADPFHNPPPSHYCTSPHLIAIAGMRLAIEELNRLSILADQYSRPTAPEQRPSTSSGSSSTLVRPSNTPNPSWSGFSSAVPSVPSTPFVPPNSPMSSEDILSLPHISYNIPGKYGRGKPSARSRLSEISDAPSIPEEPLIPDKCSDFETFPGLQDNETSSTRQASPVPSVHSAAAHFFSAANLASSPASGMKLAGHERCESPQSQYSDDIESRPGSPTLALSLHSRGNAAAPRALSLEDTEDSTPWRKIWKHGQGSASTPIIRGCVTEEHLSVDCRPEGWSSAQGGVRDPDSFCSKPSGICGSPEESKHPLTIVDEAEGSTLKENYEAVKSVSPIPEDPSRSSSILKTIPELERIAQAPGR